MNNKFLIKVKHDLCFITWIYEYITSNLKSIETDDKTILNEFIESLWWLDLNDRAIYFESWLSRTLKPHYQHIFFRELVRAIEYINIENKAKEVNNG